MRKKLNLSALAGRHRPRGWPDPRPSWAAPGSFTLSRRSLVLGAAAAAVGLSPAARAAVAALASFEFDYTDGVATFSLQGKRCWVIDPRRFAGTPRLQVGQGETEGGERWLRLSLSGARFPGLSLPADFTAEVRPAMVGSTLTLHMALGRFSAHVPLENWLAGVLPAEAVVRLSDEAAALSPDSALRLAGTATASLTPDWQLRLQERRVGRLVLRGKAYDAEQVTLMLLADTAPGLLSTRARRRSMLVLEKGREAWPPLPLAEGESACGGGKFVLEQARFDLIRVEAAESRRGDTAYALAAESTEEKGRALFRCSDERLTDSSGEPLALPITQVRAALVFQANGEDVAVTGRFGQTVAVAGSCSLSLGDNPEGAGFILQSRGGQLTDLQAAPAVLNAHLPMAGALVQAVRIPPGVTLDVARTPRRAAAAAERAEVTLTGAGALIPVSTVSVIRPLDMVNLRFDFFNLKIQVGAEGKAELVREKPGEPAHIVVHFPPQHIAEQTYNVVYGDPAGLAGARIADPSRIAFMVPDSVEAIPYRLEDLLDWKRFQLAVREAGALDLRNKPGELITAIEAPYRLWLSPVASVAVDGGTARSVFANARTPVTSSAGRTELWHTRLALLENGMIRETSLNELQLRAIWSRDLDKKPSATNQVGEYAGLDDGQVGAFVSTLTAKQRVQLVGLTTDSSLTFGRPVLTKRLMLSSLGAWLDAKGSWNVLGSPDYALALWEHQMLMARDQYVKTVELGFLFPFGHLCSLIKITSREFSESGIAYLNKRSFIVVHQPVREYSDRQLPFKRIEILDDKTPLLSDEREGFYKNDNAFWPRVGADSTPFEFHAVATDWDDNEIAFPIQLPFVMQDTASDRGLMADIRREYNEDNEERRTRALNGADVAYVPPPATETPGDGTDPGEEERVSTAFPTDIIRFQAVAPAWDGVAGKSGPRFRLVMESADIHLNQVEGLSDQSAPTRVKYHQRYIDYGFSSPGNQGQVYLQLLTSVPTSLPEDALGGMVNPDYNVSGISRTIGSVGDADNMAAGNLNASALWPGKQSRMLNLFDLTDLFPGGSFGQSGQSLQTGRAAAGWDPDLSWIPRPIFSLIREVVEEGENGEGGEKQQGAHWLAEATPPAEKETEAPPPPSDEPEPPPANTTAQTPKKKKKKKQITGYKVGFKWAPKGLLESFPKDYPIFTAYDKDADDPTELFVELTKIIQKKKKKKEPDAGGETTPDKASASVLAANGTEPPADNKKKKSSIAFAVGVRNFKLCLRWFTKPYPELFGAEFDEVSVSREDGQTELKVLISEFVFGGPLEFFNVLADLLMVQVPGSTPEEDMPQLPAPEKPPMIELFTFLPPLPAITLGVFSISNIKLGLGIGIPLQKNASDGPEFRLALSEPDDPFAFSVNIFGGGGSLGFAFTPNRLTMVEGSFEVGLVSAINFAVLKGSVSAVIGLHVRAEFPNAALNPDLPGALVQLTGYVRVSGELDLLGIIEVSVLFLLTLTYNSYDRSLSGTVTLHFKVKIVFFSIKVSVTARKVFYSKGGAASAVEDGSMPRHRLSADRKARYVNAYADAFSS